MVSVYQYDRQLYTVRQQIDTLRLQLTQENQILAAIDKMSTQ